MRPALERLQRIERYLNGKMNPVERLWLESQLLWDTDLRKEVAIQKRLFTGLRQEGRQQLKKELKGIHRQLYKDNE
jgi:hypothetical protein